ncbi:MAG: dihydrofolate reductase [Bacteroidetes bacterium]|nr:MAG: dihydrofolate reductase [Bacteroidota bacterium]
MRKLILYIATSANGKIADANGGVEWLEQIPNPDQLDYGYADFLKTVDTTIMGYSTYAQLISWDIEFPYIGLDNYVVTRKETPEDNGHVIFVKSDLETKIEELKSMTSDKDIWLVGGGSTNARMLEAGLVDEVRLFVMPIFLQSGIDLTAEMKENVMLGKPKVVVHSAGIVEMIYSLN